MKLAIGTALLLFRIFPVRMGTNKWNLEPGQRRGNCSRTSPKTLLSNRSDAKAGSVAADPDSEHATRNSPTANRLCASLEISRHRQNLSPSCAHRIHQCHVHA